MYFLILFYLIVDVHIDDNLLKKWSEEEIRDMQNGKLPFKKS